MEFVDREAFNEAVKRLTDKARRDFGPADAPSVSAKAPRIVSEPRTVRDRFASAGDGRDDLEAFERARVEAADLAAHDGHPRAVWTVQGLRFRVDPVGLAPKEWTVWESDSGECPRLSRWHQS